MSLLAVPGFLALLAISVLHGWGSLQQGALPGDLGYSPAASPLLQGAQVAALGYLTAIYLYVLAHWEQRPRAARQVALVVVSASLAMTSLLPTTSMDVFDYVGFGRLVTEYHVSPYLHTYGEFSDWFAPYVTWSEPMPYGPVVLPFFAGAAILSRAHLLLGIYGLKVAWLALHLLSTWLVYRLAGRLALDAGRSAFLFGCSPLLLFEHLGNAHDDALLVVLGLAAVWFLARDREGWAMVPASVAALAKSPGALWMLGGAILLVRRRRWHALASGVLIGAIVLGAVVLWVPGFVAAATVGNSQWQYSEDSLHTVLLGVVHRALAMAHVPFDYDAVFRVDRVAFSLLFLGVVVWRLWHVDSLRRMITETGYLTLALLLGYAVSVQPWYCTWLLPAAALTEDKTLRRTVLVFTVSVLALYAFPYQLVERGPHHDLWAGVRLIVAFGIPVAYLTGASILTRVTPPRC